MRVGVGKSGRVRTGRIGAQAGDNPAPTSLLLINSTDSLLINATDKLIIGTSAFSSDFSSGFF